ncbi:MAG: DUF1572 family protein [Phycisphaerales bacterium JB040]
MSDTRGAATFESGGGGGVVASFRQVFERQKLFGEHAINQLDDEGFFWSPPGPAGRDAGLNPVGVMAQHIGGNLASRWTDFLTTDGEKPWRDRDAELTRPEVPDAESRARERARIMNEWAAGWTALFAALDALTDADLARTVTIRGAPHTVALALARCLDHMGFHVGQMNVVARLWVGSDAWEWFTLAPGGTKAFNESMRARHTR